VTIHYDDLTLVDDNMLVVAFDCATCVNGAPTDRCTCFNGLDYECADLSIVLRNVAVAGALCAAFKQGFMACPCDGSSVSWFPGCRMEAA
jgi:hypothetical protein